LTGRIDPIGLCRASNREKPPVCQAHSGENRPSFTGKCPVFSFGAAHEFVRAMRLEEGIFFPEQGKLLRILSARATARHHQPLYEAIVLKARELGLAGATVLRGPMGFGANSRCGRPKYCGSRWICRW